MGSNEAFASVLNEGIHESHNPERVLWLCVILQQLLDATKPEYDGENSYNVLTRDRAKTWLLSTYGVTATDRDDVCHMAGVEPEALKSFTKKLSHTNEVEYVRKRINAILHETIV